jgi:cytochrome b561
MSTQIALVFVLTFIIHLISTLVYALRIAGVRTGRIALSLALFNVVALASRAANTFQGPLLAKHVEQNILQRDFSTAESDFRWLLLAATLATIVGALLIPTFQRIFTKAIDAFGVHRSVPRLLLSGLSPSNLRQIKTVAAMPTKKNLKEMSLRDAPIMILIFYVIVTALITVGVFASLYAGYLNPQLRLTANNMSPIINGLSTVLLFAFVDPYLAVLTDDVVERKVSDAFFRKCVRLFVLTRMIGTILAQLIFIPAAKFVIFVAERL